MKFFLWIGIPCLVLGAGGVLLEIDGLRRRGWELGDILAVLGCSLLLGGFFVLLGAARREAEL